MKFKSIKTKIAAFAGTCLIIASTTLVGYSVFSARSTQRFVTSRVSQLVEERSLDGLKNLAGQYAGEIASDFDVALDAARTMADTFTVAKSSENGGLDLGRDQINAILLQVLKNNPNFNGTYSCWEPDALDGQDAAFKTGRDGNNAITGRFTPYWNRDKNGRIAVQPLVEYDTMDKHPNGVLKGGWYIGPRENHKENVLDPFPYIVQGKQVWLTTLSVPVLVGGKFYGVAGTDYNLDFVQELSQNVDKDLFNGQGEVIIISNMGLIVAHSERPELIGKHVKNIIPKKWMDHLADIQVGKSVANLDRDESRFEIFAPIELGRTGKPWSLMIRVEQKVVLADAIALDEEIAALGSSSTRWQVLVGLGISILAISLLWYAAGGVARPIRGTVVMLKDIAEGEGDLTKRLEVTSEDEIGEMALWFNAFIEKLQTLIRQIVEDAGSLNELSSILSGIAGQMSAGAESMSDRSNTVAAGSEEMSTNMSGVAAACEQVAGNVNMVASATEEMTVTVKDIAQKTEKSRTITESAVSKAGDASSKLDELGQAAREISKVTEVISDISEQINLLALNATIEAARAGDAGRGFAVVATEIKELASQTAAATQEVRNQISNIQESTSDTVVEVEQILEIINEVNDIVSTVTHAMEEQAITTQEIAGNISQTSQGIQEVNLNVSQGSDVVSSISNEIAVVNQSVQEISTASGQINLKAEDLSGLSDKLQGIVGRFKV